MLAIDPHESRITVGGREALGRAALTARAINWTSGSPESSWRTITAQIRHRHAAAPARVRALDDDRAEVAFDEPQMAVTPGQAVVFYDQDEVIGGGWIE